MTVLTDHVDLDRELVASGGVLQLQRELSAVLERRLVDGQGRALIGRFHAIALVGTNRLLSLIPRDLWGGNTSNEARDVDVFANVHRKVLGSVDHFWRN